MNCAFFASRYRSIVIPAKTGAVEDAKVHSPALRGVVRQAGILLWKKGISLALPKVQSWFIVLLHPIAKHGMLRDIGRVAAGGDSVA